VGPVVAAGKDKFEKRRASDTAYRSDDIMKEIFDKKDKAKKSHNISVNTNNYTTSTNTA